jgi:hypothetical protein
MLLPSPQNDITTDQVLVSSVSASAMLSAPVKNISQAQTKPKRMATSPTRAAVAGEM